MCKVCGSDQGLRTAASRSHQDHNALPNYYCVDHFSPMLVRAHTGRCSQGAPEVFFYRREGFDLLLQSRNLKSLSDLPLSLLYFGHNPGDTTVSGFLSPTCVRVRACACPTLWRPV